MSLGAVRRGGVRAPWSRVSYYISARQGGVMAVCVWRGGMAAYQGSHNSLHTGGYEQVGTGNVFRGYGEGGGRGDCSCSFFLIFFKNLVLKRSMVPASPNFLCHFLRDQIPKGLTFGLCV